MLLFVHGASTDRGPVSIVPPLLLYSKPRVSGLRRAVAFTGREPAIDLQNLLRLAKKAEASFYFH